MIDEKHPNYSDLRSLRLIEHWLRCNEHEHSAKTVRWARLAIIEQIENYDAEIDPMNPPRHVRPLVDEDEHVVMYQRVQNIRRFRLEDAELKDA